MHFVTGGAFNGKARWVQEYYRLEDTAHKWVSCYEGAINSISSYPNSGENLIVFEGIEYLLKLWLAEASGEEVRKRWGNVLQEARFWEQGERGRHIIFIGTDITKGIVPLRAEDRMWRDVTGWVYQDCTREAQRVELIWCGLANRLK